MIDDRSQDGPGLPRVLPNPDPGLPNPAPIADQSQADFTAALSQRERVRYADVGLLVLGAGVGGATCAYTYKQTTGLPVSIFEARADHSGRARSTIGSDGRVRHEGGQLLNDSYRVIFRLADEVDSPIQRHAEADQLRTPIGLNIDRKDLSLRELIERSGPFLELFRRDYALTRGPDCEEKTIRIAELREMRARDYYRSVLNDELAIKAFDTILINEYADVEDPEGGEGATTSMTADDFLDLEFQDATPDNPAFGELGYCLSTFKNGTSDFIGKLLDKVTQPHRESGECGTIHYEHVLLSVKPVDGGYECEFARIDGSIAVVRAKLVASSIPAPVFMRDVQLEPGILSDRRIDVLREVAESWGHESKAFVLADRKGGGDPSIPETIVDDMIPGHGVAAVWNSARSQAASGPVEVTTYFADLDAIVQELGSEEEVIARLRIALDEIFPGDHHSGEALLKNWVQDRFARGSFPVLGTDQIYGLADALWHRCSGDAYGFYIISDAWGRFSGSLESAANAGEMVAQGIMGRCCKIDDSGKFAIMNENEWEERSAKASQALALLKQARSLIS